MIARDRIASETWCFADGPRTLVFRHERKIHRRAHSAAVGRNQTSVTTRTLSGPVDGGCDTERPEPRHVRNQASRFFNAEKQEGEAQRTRRGRIFGASRRVRSNTGRSAILSRWPLRLPSCFSALKNLLACLGSAAGTHYRRVSTDQHKDAPISQSTALGEILAEAPANQCVIGILVEIRRASR
jgi:hypothetical protein